MLSGRILGVVTPKSSRSRVPVQSVEFLCVYTSVVDELLAHESDQTYQRG